MLLKDKLLSSFLAFEDHLQADSPLHDMRQNALKTFEEKGFPTKKDEAWKYTSLQALLQNEYQLASKVAASIELKDVRSYFLHDLDTYKVVFVDGVYSAFLSETTHDKIDVCLLSSALQKAKYRPVIEAYFNKITRAESLSSLNTAFAKEGAYIHIPRHKEADKPIEILNFSTGSETSLFLQPRNLIVLEDNTQAQIIERHQSLNTQGTLTNTVSEIFVGKNAHLDYYKIQNDQDNASLIDSTSIKQLGGSTASVHTFSLGGKLTRNNLTFSQTESGCNSILKGITLIKERQHVDHNTLVHHQAPNCESHQDYKGIFAEFATGVFNGRVLVEKEAQKIDAFQQNNNMLLDDKATINSKPQLEIFADDVKCSHGCTIGQLDDDALFYLQSRGIPQKEATALLMYAFANNVLQSVEIPELKSRINKQIAGKLGVRVGFDL